MAAQKKSKSDQTATDLYGEALKALHNQKFDKAKDLLDQLEKDYPDDLEVLDRARTFQKLCDRRLSEKKKEDARADSAESAFDLGVFAHNNADHDRAQKHFSEALKKADEDLDYVHYAMAASLVQAGNEKEALEHLQKAVKLNRQNRFFALNDPDFRPLQENRDFQKLTGIEEDS